MKTPINLPTDKLTQWHYAITWAKIVLEQRIEQKQELNISCDYDKEKLDQLEDLDMFLQMSWNQHMDNISQTAQEVK